MKQQRPFTALLLAIMMSTCLNANGKEIKTKLLLDNEPPNPTFLFCTCCGEIWNAWVEDMPLNSSKSGIAAITMDPVKSYNYNLSYYASLPTKSKFIWGAL